MRRLSGLLLVACLVASSAWGGTVSCTRTASTITGTLFLVTGSCTMSSSYATGGDVVGTTAAAAAGVLCGSTQRIARTVLLQEHKTGRLFEYDAANFKIKAYVPVSVGASSAVAGANNTLVKVGSGVEVAGTGTAYQVAGTEVTAATNLSTTSLTYAVYCE